MAARHAATAFEADPAADIVGEPFPPTEVLVDAKYLADYRFQVWFADGFTREVDMEGELDGEVFRALKDKSEFAKLRFQPEGRTVVWPNGADLAPEFLRWGPHKDDGCDCGH